MNAAQKIECPYCGKTDGLRVACDGGGYIAPEYTCADCWNGGDTGPCFVDLPEVQNAYSATRDGLIAALTPKPTKHDLLIDVYEAMRARGDADAEKFRRMAEREFAAKLNATVAGAAWAMGCWIKKRAPHVPDITHANRKWFLAQLEAVISGSEAKAA